MLIMTCFMADNIFVQTIRLIVDIYLVQKKKRRSFVTDPIYLKTTVRIFADISPLAFAVQDESGVVDRQGTGYQCRNE